MSLLIGTTALAGCLGGEDTSNDSNLESLVVAFSLKDDYTNVDENPQRFADYLGEALNMDVSLYPIDSEGAALQALRFGNADIALMDGGQRGLDGNSMASMLLQPIKNPMEEHTTAHMPLCSKIQKLPKPTLMMIQQQTHFP